MRATFGIVTATAALCAAITACSSSSSPKATDARHSASSSSAASTATGSASAPASTSSGTISTSDWNSRVNAICATGNTKSHELGDPPGDPTDTSPAALAAMAAYLDKQNAILEDEITQIRALPQAAPGNAKAQQALADLDKGISALTDSSTAAKNGDAATFLTKFQAASNVLDTATSEATDAGLSTCADQ